MEPYASLAGAVDTIHVFHRLWQNTKESLPIRHSEMGLLMLIIKNDAPVTSSMAADVLKVKKQMITTMTAALEGKGLIEKRPSPEDGRSFILSITPQGQDFVTRRYKEYFKTIGQLKEALGDEDFNTWISLLKKASGVLEENYPSKMFSVNKIGED